MLLERKQSMTGRLDLIQWKHLMLSNVCKTNACYHLSFSFYNISKTVIFLELEVFLHLLFYKTN